MLDTALPLLLPALNRVLDTQPALLAGLAAHGGKVAQVVLPPFNLRLAIAIDGHLGRAGAEQPTTTTITLGADIPPRLLMGDKDALRSARIEGDGGLASDLMAALDQFDWALALRPYLGDIAAARAAQFFTGFSQWRDQARASLDRNLSAYLNQESGLLVDRLTMRHFVAEVDELRDAAARLDARLAVLEAKAGANDPS